MAKRVASRKTIKYQEDVFEMELAAHSRTINRGCEDTTSLSASPSTGEKLDLEVTDIPKFTDEAFLRMYFENERKTGGGTVEKLNFDPETGTAVISFKDRQGGVRVWGC